MQSKIVRFVFWAVSVAVFATTAGCAGIVDIFTEEDTRIGTVKEGLPFPVVEVPAQVAVGEPFTVLVRTYGGGCHRKGHTEVRTDGFFVFVTPYDVEREADACHAIEHIFQHEVSLTYHRAGVARIYVRARRQSDGAIKVWSAEVIVGP